MMNNFTPRAQQVLALARKEALHGGLKTQQKTGQLNPDWVE